MNDFDQDNKSIDHVRAVVKFMRFSRVALNLELIEIKIFFNQENGGK